MQAHQAPVNALHRPAGGQTQHQVWIGPKLLGDDPRHQLGGRVGVRSNNHFHGPQLTTNEGY